MTVEDAIQINVDIVRHHMVKDKEDSPLLHSLRYPFFIEEKWHIMITNSHNVMIFYKQLSGRNKILSTSYELFPTEKKVGKLNFNIYVMSDCYLGYNLEKELTINIKELDKDGAGKEFIHDEDVTLDKYKNFGEKQ